MPKAPIYDFLIIAPTPFYVNRGCHLRIRGEAEALQEKGYKVVIFAFNEGSEVAGLEIKRSFVTLGKYGRNIAASWKNIPNGLILFFSVLHETIYKRPKVIYGHLFEGAAIGIAAKYLAMLLNLFSYNPVLVLDTQGGLYQEMKSYGMLKKGTFLYVFFRGLEKFILFFPNYIFTSSVQCAENLRKTSLNANLICLPDGISIFGKNISLQTVKQYKNSQNKEKILSKIAAWFSSLQVSQIKKWLDQENLILLYTGSFSPAKGFPNFVKYILPKLIKNTGLCFLFGGGDIKDIARLGYLKEDHPDRIVVIPNLNSKNLLYFSLLGELAIDCKPPATSESSGKILNYMATGLPVVCFDQLNNQIFLREGGLYSKNFPEFYENIIKLTEDNNLRKEMGEKNLRRAWQEFTWDRTADKIVKTVMRIEE